jgi:hypothetical protein
MLPTPPLREVPAGRRVSCRRTDNPNVLRLNISRPTGTLFKEGITRYYLKCFISSRSKFHFLIITIIKNPVSPLLDVIAFETTTLGGCWASQWDGF